MSHLAYISLLSSAGALGLGLLVLLKRARHVANGLFFLVMLALGAAELCNFLVSADPLRPDALFLKRLAEAAACLLPGTLFAFTTTANWSSRPPVSWWTKPRR